MSGHLDTIKRLLDGNSLKEAKRDGLLSDEEFEASKAAILADF